MSRRISTGLLAVIGVALLASPAAAHSRREMQMMADIRMLQEQTQQLQQQMTAAVEQLTATLKTINARVDEQANATRKSFADQKLAVDQFGSDLCTNPGLCFLGCRTDMGGTDHIVELE